MAEKTPLLDEVSAIGSRLMDRIERDCEKKLASNAVFAVRQFIASLHTIGRLLIGPDDPDVRRLHDILSKQSDALVSEIVNNRDALRQRYMEGQGSIP